MLFNSAEFLFCFLPATLLGFALCVRCAPRQGGILWLVVCSIVFYAWKDPHLLLMFGSIAGNFLLGKFLTTHRQYRGRKLLLGTGITANLVLLGYYKYANFLGDSLATMIGSSHSLPPIVLPLAISFYTFLQIAYLVDTYRESTREYSFIDYCLFVTFFPHLIAGPIIHHKEMIPQFAKRREQRQRMSDFAVGCSIFLVGLFKKVVFADNVAQLASPIFDGVEGGYAPSFLAAWIAALAYTLQLYFDFSGYSDMAIGLARMFGILFPLNFNSPYKSVNIVDFWRRWHMTLSRFLRDYLYISLGGNRHGPVRRYLNLFLTMLLGGLWHGAGWTFVFWGALHGTYLVVNHAWQQGRRSLGLTGNSIGARCIYSALGRVCAGSLTFLAVIVGWVFFRSASFVTATTMLTAMSGAQGFGLYLPEAIELRFAVLWLGILLPIVWLMPNTQEIFARYRPALDFESHSVRERGTSSWNWQSLRLWRPNLGWALVMSGVAVVCLLEMSKVSEFIYYQF